MKVLVLFFISVTLAAPKNNLDLEPAQHCDQTSCVLPNCKCSSTIPPDDLDPSRIPQLVFLTFDDAVTELNFEIYSSLFYNLTNPDGCPISTTYFVSHEYTDYSKVHDLYVHNQEIALHSITHSTNTDYWRNMSQDTLSGEFGDEKTLISHFASIPIEAFEGMRLPYLQLDGDSSFVVAKDLGLKYDCSWPTEQSLWPYTLDYESTQECPIEPCPKSSIPGLWVIPMIMWSDQAGIVCSMIDACVNIPVGVKDLLQWFIDNFNLQYKSNKAPVGFYVHEAWFEASPVHLEAYKQFLTYLLGLNDVYLVSITNGLKWIQNPVPIGSPDWPACPPVIEDTGCTRPTVCPLQKGEEERYMTICSTACPDVYPWLGNPLGRI